jgi:hypothetical protein
MEVLWLSQERDKIVIRYLAEVIRWTNTPYDRYNRRKFRREEMENNVLLLNLELEWFKSREKERKLEGRGRVQGERKKTLRKRNRHEKEDEGRGVEEGGRRKRMHSKEEKATEGKGI